MSLSIEMTGWVYNCNGKILIQYLGRLFYQAYVELGPEFIRLIIPKDCTEITVDQEYIKRYLA